MPSNTRSNAARETSTAPIGTSPPDSALATHTMSGCRSQCSSARKRPVRPMPVCTSSQTNSAPASRHSRCAPGQIVPRREVDPLALDRLDDERRDVPACELARERVQIAEADRIAARQQRPEALAELDAAVERQRAEREPVEGVLGVQDARTAGGGARDLDRRLDRLGAGVRGDHRGDAVGSAREQLLGEHAAEQRHAQLREVARARRHHLLDRRDRLRMVAPDREHPVAPEQVEVALPVGVDQVRPLPPLHTLSNPSVRRIRPICGFR